jgi:hypothetical protein
MKGEYTTYLPTPKANSQKPKVELIIKIKEIKNAVRSRLKVNASRICLCQ